jgi:hypothetical protein
MIFSYCSCFYVLICDIFEEMNNIANKASIHGPSAPSLCQEDNGCEIETERNNKLLV